MTRWARHFAKLSLALWLGAAASPSTADISVAVADAGAPLAAQDWPEQGLATAVVRNALALQAPDEDVRILWTRERSAPLELVHQHRAELALPVPRPPCRSEATELPCGAFHYSDPIVEIIWRLFAHHDREITYDTPADLVGKRLCLAEPADRIYGSIAGIGVVENVLGEIRRARTLEECFSLLLGARVDAVIADEFSGVQALFDQNLTETVVPLPRPLGSQSLHVAVSRSHWRATTLIYRVNAGLAGMKQSGAYQALVARHVERFWEDLSLRAR